MALKLWRISQSVNKRYDTYDSAVVVASSWSRAKACHPAGDSGWESAVNAWAKAPEQVEAIYLGEAGNTELQEGEVVCASFNAG